MAEQPLTIDLSAPARVADVPELARRFLIWWADEIFALLPSALRAALPRARRPALLFARRDRWRIVSGDDDGHALDLDVSGSDSAIAEQILQGGPDFAVSRLTVVLPRDRVLLRRIELPMMPEASVRDAVTLLVDRLSPFKPDAVRVATRVVARHIIEGKLEADVAFAPRAQVEQLEARLRALGLKPVAVDVEGENGGPAGFDLSPPREAGADRRSIVIHAALAAGAAVTWLIASYAPDVAREREIQTWQDRVSELKPLAQRAAGLRRQVEGMIEPLAIARSHKPAQTLSILTELTNLLPDDARLIELRLAGNGVELTGVAAKAPALIGKLESSKEFGEVKFRAPVTRWQGTALDRFEITAKLERGKGK